MSETWRLGLRRAALPSLDRLFVIFGPFPYPTPESAPLRKENAIFQWRRYPGLRELSSRVAVSSRVDEKAPPPVMMDRFFGKLQ